MNSHEVSERIAKMASIDRIAKPVQNGVAAFYRGMGESGKMIEDFLHGSLLGHPLHPSLVHLPVGAFMLAAVTDVFASIPSAATTSQVAIFVGLLAMVPALVTGVTDWYPYGDDSVRRIGGLHMLANWTALLLYVVSGLCRFEGALGVGIFFGYLGFLSIGFSGYLGGLLVFTRKVGVDHTPQTEELTGPATFLRVIALAELEEAKPKKVMAGEIPVVLVRMADLVLAMPNACAHEGGPLSDGRVEDGCLVCPWHESKFRLSDGSVAGGPSVYSQPRYPCRVVDGQVEVMTSRVPEVPPVVAVDAGVASKVSVL